MKNKGLIVGIASLIYGIIKDLAILISGKQSMLEFLDKYLDSIFIVFGLGLIIYWWLDKKYQAIELRFKATQDSIKATQDSIKETNDSIKKSHKELFDYAHNVQTEMREGLSRKADSQQLEKIRVLADKRLSNLKSN
jgi:hypothetical protein